MLNKSQTENPYLYYAKRGCFLRGSYQCTSQNLRYEGNTHSECYKYLLVVIVIY